MQSRGRSVRVVIIKWQFRAHTHKYQPNVWCQHFSPPSRHHLSPSLTVNKSVFFSDYFFRLRYRGRGKHELITGSRWFTLCVTRIIGAIWHHQTRWPATLFRNRSLFVRKTLTSASRECRFINSSVSNFSFWFGTTRGILKRNLGFVGGTSACVWGCWLWLGWWWPGLGCPNISPWCPPAPGPPGCWAAGWWPKGNMLKEDGAALCSMAALTGLTLTKLTPGWSLSWGYSMYRPQCLWLSPHTPRVLIEWLRKPQNFVTRSATAGGAVVSLTLVLWVSTLHSL